LRPASFKYNDSLNPFDRMPKKSQDVKGKK
jgi:hypothetical protein